MRRKCFLLAIAVISIAVMPSISYGLPRLLLFEFGNKTDDPAVPANAITDMMITELSKARIFTLIEYEKRKQIGDEVRFHLSGLVDPSTAVEAGKSIGAQYAMTGAVTMYFYNEKGGNKLFRELTGGIPEKKTAYVMLDIRIIDIATGEIIYANDALGSAKREASVSVRGGIVKTYGGILAEAARDAVSRHVSEIKRDNWQ